MSKTGLKDLICNETVCHCTNKGNVQLWHNGKILSSLFPMLYIAGTTIELITY